jgi:hypothetical protein
MKIKSSTIVILISITILACKHSFNKKEVSIINTYNVGDTLVFRGDKGLFDSIEIIDKQLKYNGASEGYSGNPETGFILYKTVPASKPELVGFGGSQGDVYSNEKYLLSAVKWDKNKPATIEIKFGGFDGMLPQEQDIVTDDMYGGYYNITHFCIDCIGVDSTDVIRVKWKPGVGIIWYQRKDSSTYTLVKTNSKSGR